MNGGGRQCSLGGHMQKGVRWGMASLSMHFIGQRVGRKGVGRGCVQRKR
jgi:hypothetical protein